MKEKTIGVSKVEITSIAKKEEGLVARANESTCSRHRLGSAVSIPIVIAKYKET